MQKTSKYSKEELKKRLTPLQYYVTQQNGTQPAFDNAYNNTMTEGTYSCIVCSHPLFSSQMKYSCECGWPAFYDEFKDANIKRIQDFKHGLAKIELRCGKCDSHLGHLFNRRPKGVRYCINSASIDFKEMK